ncbi:MAG TPA: FAD-dependent oxidoreductase [Candidatus Limnocylindrales bacterium]|nr:FAD-dependent oxidoreductase [Candidatus Limnocylindrales bacterium]
MSIVIIGAGPAGITVAETIRRFDRDVPITVISAESFPPYSPPAMADHFLTGRDDPLYWMGRDVGERLGLDVRDDRVVASVLPDAHEVVLADGSTVPFGRLVIASGSRLHADLPGNELRGIHDFKSLRAARALLDRVRRGEVRTALIVGAGFIGMEIALLLADLGIRVTMLERLGWVMPRILDPETAGIAARIARERGVELRLGAEVSRFLGTDVVEGVEMADGAVLTADAYVAATGVKPHLEFLAATGIDAGWGIRVDDHLRTSVRDVWAAGDVVEAADRLTGERYVHAIFPNAVAQGEVVGRNLVGLETTYPGAESMNSLKHLGLPILAVGAMTGDEEFRWRNGDVLRKVFVTDGRIVGFRLTGDIGGGGILRSLMLTGRDVGGRLRHIADPGAGMAEIVFGALPA